jgi:hypothetical protein
MRDPLQFPFGNPDGARSSLQDLLDEFVPLDGAMFGPGLGTKAEDLGVRVIVGAKGSGKTVYLRRLQASASANPAVYADAIQYDLPATSLVVRFGQEFPAQFTIERWSQLWYCAILRSLISHLLNAPTLREHLSATARDDLLRYEGRLHPKFEVPLSAYSQAIDILVSHTTENQYNRYFNDPAWPVLETYVARAVQDAPPVCFFIDAVDEEYARAPMYWERCQEGLFERIMRFLREPRLGGRLHVVTCIRDHVLNAVLQGENAAKYHEEPHIRKLGWTHRATRHFLDKKIEHLDERLLMRPGWNATPIERWLGLRRIHNVERGIDEEVGSYLLRHTRLLPRDVVVLGNALCAEVLRTRERGDETVAEDKIREIVASNSRLFGQEQLAICANQLAADLMPRNAGRHDFVEAFVDVEQYRNQLADKLRGFIAQIAFDHFESGVFQVMKASAKEKFDGHSEVFTILWQNGLLGYREARAGGGPDRYVFSSLGRPGEFALPQKREYVLHSMMIDAVDVKAVGDDPVVVE